MSGGWDAWALVEEAYEDQRKYDEAMRETRKNRDRLRRDPTIPPLSESL
jgi:hypothetical protein